jgi:hypothetical protein
MTNFVLIARASGWSAGFAFRALMPGVRQG